MIARQLAFSKEVHIASFHVLQFRFASKPNSSWAITSIIQPTSCESRESRLCFLSWADRRRMLRAVPHYYMVLPPVLFMICPPLEEKEGDEDL